MSSLNVFATSKHSGLEVHSISCATPPEAKFFGRLSRIWAILWSCYFSSNPSNINFISLNGTSPYKIYKPFWILFWILLDPKSLVDTTKKNTNADERPRVWVSGRTATLAALLGALVQLAGLKKSLFGCHPRHSNTWKRCVDFAQKHWINNDVVFFLCADNDNSLRFCGVVSAFRDVQSKSNSANKPHQEMPKQKG